MTEAQLLDTGDVRVWDVPGQEHAVAVLRGAVERGEVSHAFAFLGPSGVGQLEAGRWLSAALNCERQAPPCGQCSVCRRAVRGAFPALEEFVATGAFHRVEEVRELWLPVAFRTPAEGRWKVLHVVDADRMNESAANAFLKGLEEPPPNTVWLLDIADPDQIPDTILSRCRLVRFSPWSLETLDGEAQRLGLTDPDERALAIRAALGSPLTLRRLAEPGALDEYRAHRAIPGRLRNEGPVVALLATKALQAEATRRTEAIRAQGKAELDELAELSGGEPSRSAVKQLTERYKRLEREAKLATILAGLDDVLVWLRDCLVVGAGGDLTGAVNSDAGDELRADAEAFGPAGLLEGVDVVLQLRDDLVEFNLAHAVALEAVFLKLSALTRRS